MDGSPPGQRRHSLLHPVTAERIAVDGRIGGVGIAGIKVGAGGRAGRKKVPPAGLTFRRVAGRHFLVAHVTVHDKRPGIVASRLIRFNGFGAASLLFVMTFVINTVAELIRQRLRERYKAI